MLDAAERTQHNNRAGQMPRDGKEDGGNGKDDEGRCSKRNCSKKNYRSTNHAPVKGLFAVSIRSRRLAESDNRRWERDCGGKAGGLNFFLPFDRDNKITPFFGIYKDKKQICKNRPFIGGVKGKRQEAVCHNGPALLQFFPLPPLFPFFFISRAPTIA